jgi:hypothetical protein
LALTLPAALATASPAAANHIAGATYNGTEGVGNSAMSFAVDGSGSGISSFSITGPLPGSICTFSGISATYITPLPIVSHAFTDSTPPLTFSGSFTGPQSAQGTLRMNAGGCDTGNVAWSATTTAAPAQGATPSPAGSEQCKAAKAKVKTAKKKLQRAKTASAKKKAKKTLKKAKRRERAVCLGSRGEANQAVR